jgi:chromosome partitioning protein
VEPEEHQSLHQTRNASLAPFAHSLADHTRKPDRYDECFADHGHLTSPQDGQRREDVGQVKIVSVINYKGGVGKTTLTANLGSELARRGSRVLLIDLDPQCSLTFSFYSPSGLGPQVPANHTIKAWYETFVDGIPQTQLSQYMVAPKQINDRVASRGGFLGLVPSSLTMIDMDLQLLTNAGLGSLPADVEVYRLRRALAATLAYPGLAQYDYVLIDCPPNFNIVTQAAIVASKHLLIPARPDHLSTLGIESLLGAVELFTQSYNNQVQAYSTQVQADLIAPRPLGVAFSMVRYAGAGPINDHRYFMERVRNSLSGLRVFNASVRENAAFGKVNNEQLPVIMSSAMTQAYYMELMELATEVEKALREDTTGRRAAA